MVRFPRTFATNGASENGGSDSLPYVGNPKFLSQKGDCAFQAAM